MNKKNLGITLGVIGTLAVLIASYSLANHSNGKGNYSWVGFAGFILVIFGWHFYHEKK